MCLGRKKVHPGGKGRDQLSRKNKAGGSKRGRQILRKREFGVATKSEFKKKLQRRGIKGFVFTGGTTAGERIKGKTADEKRPEK